MKELHEEQLKIVSTKLKNDNMLEKIKITKEMTLKYNILDKNLDDLKNRLKFDILMLFFMMIGIGICGIIFCASFWSIVF